MKQFLIIICFAFWVFTINAQSKIEVKEQTEDIGGGNHNALVVKIFQTNEEDVLKEWKNIMKDYDAKISTKKKEMFADNAIIKDMSQNSIDIYARAESNSEGDIVFVVGFDLGGAFMASGQHPKEFKEAKRIVLNFAKDLSEKGFKNRVKIEEKALLGLQKQKENIGKENENLTRDIENFKEKIAKAEEKIKTNKENILLKEKEIDEQQKILDAIIKKSDIK